MTAEPALPPVCPVNGPVPLVVAVPLESIVIVLNPLFAIYPTEPKSMVGCCVTLPAKLKTLANNKQFTKMIFNIKNPVLQYSKITSVGYKIISR